MRVVPGNQVEGRLHGRRGESRLGLWDNKEEGQGLGLKTDKFIYRIWLSLEVQQRIGTDGIILHFN